MPTDNLIDLLGRWIADLEKPGRDLDDVLALHDGMS